MLNWEHFCAGRSLALMRRKSLIEDHHLKSAFIPTGEALYEEKELSFPLNIFILNDQSICK